MQSFIRHPNHFQSAWYAYVVPFFPHSGHTTSPKPVPHPHPTGTGVIGIDGIILSIRKDRDVAVAPLVGMWLDCKPQFEHR